jgi:hypothetical protein
MTTLPTAVKVHIVTALACFYTPAQVAEAVRIKFGIQVSRQCIGAHNPERAAGARLSEKWRTMFYSTRARLLADLENIPIACQSYRLRQLGRLLEQAEGMGNLELANQILQQAAKEVGGMYLKRQRLQSMDSSAD